MTNFDGDPCEKWQRECELAERAPHDAPHHELQGDYCIDAAERLLAVARSLKGVACKTCGGIGHRAYGNTATWSGGFGGQAITEGVCDSCWGTGRTDQTGANLRKIRGEHMRLRLLLSSAADWWGNDELGRQVHAEICKEVGK